MREMPPRVTICSDPAGLLPGPDRPPPGRNMPSSRTSAQGGKLGHRPAASAKSRIALRALSGIRHRLWRSSRGRAGKQPLTLFACVPIVSSKIWAWRRSS